MSRPRCTMALPARKLIGHCQGGLCWGMRSPAWHPPHFALWPPRKRRAWTSRRRASRTPPARRSWGRRVAARPASPSAWSSSEARPPFRPLALAAASPAIVRSRMSSRSKLGQRAEDVEDELPTGPCWCRRPRRASGSRCHVSRRASTFWMRSLSERPKRSRRQTTKVSPSRGVLHGLGEDGPVGAGAGGALLEELVAAGGAECVELERGVLIDGGDAGVADEHGRHDVDQEAGRGGSGATPI